MPEEFTVRDVAETVMELIDAEIHEVGCWITRESERLGTQALIEETDEDETTAGRPAFLLRASEGRSFRVVIEEVGG